MALIQHFPLHGQYDASVIYEPFLGLEPMTLVPSRLKWVWKTENATASDSIVQWTTGTFSIDAKDAGKGEREKKAKAKANRDTTLYQEKKPTQRQRKTWRTCETSF